MIGSKAVILVGGYTVNASGLVVKSVKMAMELPSGVVALSVASGDPNRGEMDAASVVGQDWRLLKHPESSDSCSWPS